jgi:hypothetical protein
MRFKKWIIISMNRVNPKSILLTIVLLLMISGWVYGESEPQKDSQQLQFQDMLMLFVLPEIDKAIADYYSNWLTTKPVVYPYMINIVKSERLNGFRGYDFKITLEVTPVVGPHISVGKDRLTLEITPTIPQMVKMVKYQHLTTEPLPPHWQKIIKHRRR